MISIVEKTYAAQAQKGQGIFWSEAIHSWMVLDPEIGLSILRSGNFLVSDYAARPREVAERSGIDIKRILDGLRDAPLANNGEAHRKARRRFASAIAPKTEAAAEAFEQRFVEEVQHVLAKGGSVDLFSELLLPAVNAALAVLGGRQIDAERFKVASPSQLFSTSQIFSGPRLATLNADISEVPEDENAPECPHLMSLFAADPTIGSLGQSLVTNLQSNPGVRLCDIKWSRELVRTSLPFTERRSTSDVQVGAVHIREGEAVWIYLGAFGADSRLHFGAGLHRCLGEHLARQIWSRLCGVLSGRDELLEVEDVVYRGADFAFVMPIKI